MAQINIVEYNEIDRMLEPFVAEHELDDITVSSLIRGSIEILEPEMPMASVASIDVNNFTDSWSIKPTNLRVNLKFAFNSIFSVKSIHDAEGIWLIIVILKAIVFLLADMLVTLDKTEAQVLFGLYRLQSATCGSIAEYVNRALKKNEEDDDIPLEDIQAALDNLEKIGTVKMDNGKYCMRESILIRRS